MNDFYSQLLDINITVIIYSLTITLCHLLVILMKLKAQAYIFNRFQLHKFIFIRISYPIHEIRMLSYYQKSIIIYPQTLP